MWACGKFAAAQFLERLDTGFTICENACVVVALDYVRTKVFGGSCNRKCLDLTRQPGDL